MRVPRRQRGIPSFSDMQAPHSAIVQIMTWSRCGKLGGQGPQSSPDLEAAPRRLSQGVNPPIRLGGDSVINGKGITVRKMPRNSIRP